MHFEDVGFIGWIHGLACVAALFTGAWNMVVFDRGRWHQMRGKVYVWSMMVANLLAFAIFDFDISFTGPPGAGVFGFFHWLAAGALIFTLLGWFASKRQRHAVWAYVHPVSMMLSYYVLAGGLANELFARVDALRPLATTMVDGHRQFGSRIVGMTQGAIMLVTLLLILLFVARVALRRNRKAGRAKALVAAAG